jgi:hypothetical protein
MEPFTLTNLLIGSGLFGSKSPEMLSEASWAIAPTTFAAVRISASTSRSNGLQFSKG